MTQLGFGFEEMAEEQRVAHLPATMEAAVPYYRGLIDRHHAAMMAGNEEQAMATRHEARDLAVKLNNGEPGILAPDAPGTKLEEATAAPEGTIPLWGQRGNYTITVGDMPVRIEQDGMFGVGSSIGYWMGFSTHAVDRDRPFLSETGYRSFLGVNADPAAGITPDEFTRRAIEAYVRTECKGTLRKWTDWVERQRQSSPQRD